MFALSPACLPLLLYAQISGFDFQILDSLRAALEAVSSTEVLRQHVLPSLSFDPFHHSALYKEVTVEG